MIDTNCLRGLLARKGLSQRRMAEILGITPKTFYEKMKKGVFDSDEMMQMITILGINDPMPIFFVEIGT